MAHFLLEVPLAVVIFGDLNVGRVVWKLEKEYVQKMKALDSLFSYHITSWTEEEPGRLRARQEWVTVLFP